MDTKTFLETTLAESGYFCVFAVNKGGHLVQKFYDSLDAVVDTAQSLDGNGYDTYFALGTFADGKSRKATNVLEMRSFFLDLDCGPTKDYPTQTEALAALRKFCKQVGMPRPTIVNSGRGIHVYWPLIEPVARDAWIPVAQQFKRVCAANNMKCDPAVPADAARVLRIPGTHNYKDDPPHPVAIVGSPGDPITFATFCDVLNEVDDSTVLRGPTKYTPAEADSFMQALTGSFVSRFKTIMMRSASDSGCAQLQHAVVEQSNLSEPLWRATLSIAKFCVDGSKAIHKVSEKHPEYTYEATESKADLIKGPYLCSRFDEYNPGVCPECKHWNKIKSPIVLGREVQEADESDNVVVQKPFGIPNAAPVQFSIPKYPHPYFRGKSGGVFKRVTDDSGDEKEKLVYYNDLYVLRRLKDPDAGESIVMRLHLPKDGVREFTIPLTAVGTKDEFRKYLAMQGVAVLNVTELMEYTMRWVSELQFAAEADEARRQFGWTDDAGTSFVVGGMEIYKDRVEINSPSAATVQLFPMFTPRGTFDGWKQIMQFYNRPGFEMHQFMIGMSFGAPLMHFQPLNAAAFHVYSKGSGLGKTTAMMAGASVWGDPDLLVMQERDTYNSKMNRSEVYKNIICYMDEMTNTSPKDLSDWAYQLPAGLQRNRMSSKGNVERARGKPWKTFFGTTGNTAMVERISLYKALPQAEAQRILEYRAQPIAFDTKSETDTLSANIKENYGHAAVPYMQYLMNNLDAAKELCVATQSRIDEAAGLKAENRFWSVLVSRTLAGLILAKKAGLLDWDIPAVSQWAIQMLKDARASMSDVATDVETLLAEYLAEHYNSILRIRSTEDLRKNSGVDNIIHPQAIPRGDQFVARYEYDVKKLYLLPKPLRAWCGKQQINYSGFIDGLRLGRTKARKEKMRLTRGTYSALPPADVVVLDCTEFMSDETEQSMAANAALFEKQNMA